MKAESLSQVDRTVRFLREYVEQPFVSHEWEELVEKLSLSEDPKLREIGLFESEFLKMGKTSFRRN